jgi:hypothetical protein
MSSTPSTVESILEALLADRRVRWYSKPLQKQARNVLRRFSLT